MKQLRTISAALFALLLTFSAAFAFTGSVKTLVSTGITTALSAQAQTAITGQDGATGLTLVASFLYGSGGTSAVVVVSTSCDGGSVWYDIAYFGFTTASATKYANLSGLTPKAPAAYAALVADGVNDGLICPQIRAVLTTVGTYANSTLSVRASLR